MNSAALYDREIAKDNIRSEGENANAARAEAIAETNRRLWQSSLLPPPLGRNSEIAVRAENGGPAMHDADRQRLRLAWRKLAMPPVCSRHADVMLRSPRQRYDGELCVAG
ncbi:hypothetical protein PanNE5_36240 [Pandoraea sp. NE5]|nr:hypothetical protein PanNE5_36240 [Pandoraea sp. NE5]